MVAAGGGESFSVIGASATPKSGGEKRLATSSPVGLRRRSIRFNVERADVNEWHLEGAMLKRTGVRMKELLAGILNALLGLGGALLVVLVVVVNLRSCVSSVWLSGDEPEIYAAETENGLLLTTVVLPSNKVAMLFSDYSRGKDEAALVRWRGSLGKHYGFGLWYFDSGEPILGPNLRKFPAGFEPAYMEMTWLESYTPEVGGEDRAFPPEGSKLHEFVLFAKDRSALSMEGVVLPRVESLDPPTAYLLRSYLRDEESREALRGIASGRESAIRAFLAAMADHWNGEGAATCPDATEGPGIFCFENMRVELVSDGLGLIRHLRLSSDLDDEQLGALELLMSPPYEDICREPVLSILRDYDARFELHYYSSDRRPLFRQTVRMSECQEFERLF